MSDLHELRGGRANWAFAPDKGRIRLRRHGTLWIFFTEILHTVQNFCEKE
jgi:hypothetical protein